MNLQPLLDIELEELVNMFFDPKFENVMNDITSMATELWTEFIMDYKRWIDDGAIVSDRITHETPFTRTEGLCANFGMWFNAKVGNHFSIERSNVSPWCIIAADPTSKKLMRPLEVASTISEGILQKAFGCGVMPFTTARQYSNERDTATAHQNALRVAYIQSIANNV